jgi:hypothetical protein
MQIAVESSKEAGPSLSPTTNPTRLQGMCCGARNRKATSWLSCLSHLEQFEVLFRFSVRSWIGR